MDKDIINEWIKLYNSPMSSSDIAKKYNVSTNTVLKYLRLSDVYIRNTAPLNVRNKRYFNEDFFEKVDNESKAYFLGLLYADGNISSMKYSNTLTLSLKKEDSDILLKFINILEGEHKLYDNINQYRLTLGSKKLIKDLNKLGIFPNKTNYIKFPNINKLFNRHFIRGFFDGDGCISTKKDKRTNHYSSTVNICCASDDFIEDLVMVMNDEIGVKKNKIRNPTGTYNIIEWGSMRDIERIYHYFYDDSNYYINRKRDRFDIAYNISKNKLKYRK